MANYIYPAIFTPDNDGGYSVEFPDLDGCYTFGDSLADSLIMAKDALSLYLYDSECSNRIIPVPTKEDYLDVESNQFIRNIHCNTTEYRKCLEAY